MIANFLDDFKTVRIFQMVAYFLYHFNFVLLLFGRQVSWTGHCWATPAGARPGRSSSFFEKWAGWGGVFLKLNLALRGGGGGEKVMIMAMMLLMVRMMMMVWLLLLLLLLMLIYIL